jgi:hypothetical protein
VGAVLSASDAPCASFVASARRRGQDQLLGRFVPGGGTESPASEQAVVRLRRVGDPGMVGKWQGLRLILTGLRLPGRYH